MNSGDERRITRLATDLVREIESIILRMDTASARKGLFVQETSDALDSIKNFLVLISQYSNAQDLSVSLHPIGKAMRDLKITGATPPMFKRKAMSKSPMRTNEKQIRLACAWLQRVYRGIGCSPSNAAKHVQDTLGKWKTANQPTPKIDTIKKWYYQSKTNGIWHDEYQKLLDTVLARKEQKNLRSIHTINKYAEELIERLRFGP